MSVIANQRRERNHDAAPTWARVLAERDRPDRLRLLAEDNTASENSWRSLARQGREYERQQCDRLLEDGIRQLSRIFPSDTTYTRRELADSESASVVHDCEIGTKLTVDEAHALLQRFEPWLLENGDLKVTFTLKFE